MIDDPISLLSAIIWIAAISTWPVGFLFGTCSRCCEQECGWFLEFERCLRVEIVGSEPRVGGDCRIRTYSWSDFDDVHRTDLLIGTYAGMTIYNAQSRIKIPVRIRLLASGEGRTPIGATRTQVWRFNRGEPQNPPASAYDVLGPPWHLQVDISVTGVALQEDAGVVSSIEQDEYGQPKLVVSVRQWDEDITHVEVVTLFPVGLQRLGGEQQSYRITRNERNATLVSGSSYPNWTVSKAAGLTVEERKLAVVVARGSQGQLLTTCTGGVIRSSVVILDDQTAALFLNGEHEVVISVDKPPFQFEIDGPAGERSLRIMPNNAMCELSSKLIGTGIALGIYPEKVYAQPEDTDFFCNTGPIVMRNAGYRGLGLSSSWGTTWSFRNALRGAAFPWLEVTPEFFYAGKSLMWNAEYGPYRETGVASDVFTQTYGFMDYEFHLNGSGDEYYNLPDAGPCPDDMVLGGGLTAQQSDELQNTNGFSEDYNYYQVCTPASVEVQGTYQIEYFFIGPEKKTVSGSMQGTLTRDVDQSIMTFGVRRFVPSLRFSSTNLVGEEIQETDANGNTIVIRPSFDVYAEVPCSKEGSLTIKGVHSSFGTVLSAEITTPIPFASRDRPSCGEWTVAPPEGGQITRQCNNHSDPSLETAIVPPRRSRFPMNRGYSVGTGASTTGFLALFYGPGPTQLGECKLLGVRLALEGVGYQSNPLVVVPTFRSGECLRYFLAFGSDVQGTDFTGDLSGISTKPCEDCTPVVDILSGAENATVQLVQDADNSYAVEVQARREWRGADGVTFSVTCGSATFNQEIRRRNTAPSAPLNLAVTRGPCSEAVLRWESPEWDGGSPITSYTVYYGRSGLQLSQFSTVPPETLSATVTGLVRLGYDFRVAATNSVGTGARSNVASSGFRLGPPTNLRASPREPCDQVTLSWTPPTQSECVVVKEYRVQSFFVAGEPLVDIPVPGNVTTVTVTGLSPTVAREFRVRQEDDAGNVLFTNVLKVDGCPPE